MSKFYKLSADQVVQWVKSNFPEHKARKNGSELTINSPFDDDTGHNFNINVTDEPFFCHDWRSDDWAGPPNPKTGKRRCTFLNFVKRYLNCTFHQAVAAVVGAESLPSLRRAADKDDAAVQRIALPAGSKSLGDSDCPKAAAIVTRWLASRGIDRALANFYGIHHCGTDAVFPYFEYGDLVYWQTRSAVDKTFRFPDEKAYGVSKGQFLYNFDGVEPASYIIVTEAVIGSISIGDQAVATGGADMTAMQARKIKMVGPREGVVLAPDNDLAGIKSVIHNGAILAGLGFQVYFSLPPRIPFVDADGIDRFTKDWNELETGPRLSKHNVRKILEQNVKPYDIAARVSLCAEVATLEQKRKL